LPNSCVKCGRLSNLSRGTKAKKNKKGGLRDNMEVLQGEDIMAVGVKYVTRGDTKL